MGKKTVNENTTVVDLRKKAPQHHVNDEGKQGAISVEAPSGPEPASIPQTFTPAPKKIKLPKPSLHSKKSKAAVIVLILIIGVTGFLIIRHRQAQAKLDCNKSYCQQILSSAVTAFNTNKIEDQTTIVTKITAIPKYQQQPNYMAILTAYYINRSDYDAAQKNLELLKKVYVPDTGYNTTLTEALIIQPPAGLEQAVTAMLRTQQNYQQNGYGITQDGTTQKVQQ